jgi:hypothetical protein
MNGIIVTFGATPEVPKLLSKVDPNTELTQGDLKVTFRYI